MSDQTTESSATPGSPAAAGQSGSPDPSRSPSEPGARTPGPARAADTAGRVWGLIVLLVGLWFFADVTLGLDMPSIPWRDLWPVGLIVIGLAIVVRGMGRRSA